VNRSRTPGLATIFIGATFAVSLLVAYVASGWLAQGSIVEGWAGSVLIDAPNEVDAGRAITVVVTSTAQDGTQVQLGVFAPLDSALLTATQTQGVATFVIGEGTTRHSGLYRFVAQIGRGISDVHEIHVSPLDPVHPVVPLVGPRTIIADGVDISMTVVTPMDRYGNPVADDTSVDIEIVRPTGQSAVVAELVARALVAVVIEATTETGRVTVSASSGTADGPSNVVDQVAGVPSGFAVVVDERDTLADGFALRSVQTSELRDEFGNLLPDGVSAVFVVQDSNGQSFLQAVVQGGIARTMIEAPNLPGTVAVTARVSGVESSTTTIDFGPAVASLAAIKNAAIDDQVIVAVGPVVSNRGGYVPDGTTVVIRDRSSGGVLAESALRSGFAEIVLDAVDALEIDVEVLGARIAIDEP